MSRAGALEAPGAFEGVLFFPVTPFGPGDDIDIDVYAEHVADGLGYHVGAVFPGCGAGEFHALSPEEIVELTRTTASIVTGSVPLIPGVGGAVSQAVATARAVAEVGADALLVLPPYLVASSPAGLVRYVEEIVTGCDLPVIVYHRNNARYSADAIRTLAHDPRVIGFKDGTGDIARAQEVVLAVRSTGRTDFRFFNGLPTAELSQAAYRGIGIPLYSSAVFAMSPLIGSAFYEAYTTGDDERRLDLLADFYAPLSRLREETPGFAVALIKAGLRLRGVNVGPVRAPLTEPTPDQLRRLSALVEIGERTAARILEGSTR